ncbi:MAG: hypothetical protein ACKVQR_06035 [Aquabacterium sp.]
MRRATAERRRPGRDGPGLARHPRLAIRGGLLNTVAALVVVMALAATAAPGAALQVMRPLLRAALSVAAAEFRVVDLDVVPHAGLLRLRLVVTLAAPLHWRGQVVQPDPRGRATSDIPVRPVLLMPLVSALLAAGWPPPESDRVAAPRAALRLRRAALAATMAMAAVPVVAAIETTGGIWKIVQDTLAPHAPSPMSRVTDLLQGGGRRVVAAALAALAVLALRPRPRPAGAGPAPRA